MWQCRSITHKPINNQYIMFTKLKNSFVDKVRYTSNGARFIHIPQWIRRRGAKNLWCILNPMFVVGLSAGDTHYKHRIWYALVWFQNLFRVYPPFPSTPVLACISPPGHSECIWWRHQMETFSALLALCAGNLPVTGEFPSQRPVTRSFGVFFDMRQIKRLSKQS